MLLLMLLLMLMLCSSDLAGPAQRESLPTPVLGSGVRLGALDFARESFP